MELLRARDEHAFNLLVRAHEVRVYRLAYRMLGRKEEAEDVAQDAFVQVFRSIEQYRGESLLGTWILRITSNLCKNRIRYLSRRLVSGQAEYCSESELAAHGQAQGLTSAEIARPDQVVQGYELEELVRRAVLSLEPDFREAIILRDVEELSYQEIVQITNLPEGTVKSRIFRARALLKERVAHALGDKIG
jgi:RNA polymerase sigma-70 factor (ECF subfamily)